MTAEHTRIVWLRARFAPPAAPALGIGDDAAVLVGAEALVATVDAAVEGVHFRRDLCSLEEASARAVEAAASDVAAMGGSLRGPGAGILLAWTLPPALDDDDFLALVAGASRAARRLGASVVGGNLSSGPVLGLTTTVLGRLHGPPLTRDGALPGDVLAVTGSPGLAGLGLRALLDGRGHDPTLGPAVLAWRCPEARLEAGAALVGRAHAAIDLSDGLLQDAAHLALASGVCLTFDAERLGALPGLAGAAAALGGHPVRAALTGGEDYELLASGPAEVFGRGWHRIGAVTAGDGVYLQSGTDRRRLDDDPGLQGFDHFREAVNDRGR